MKRTYYIILPLLMLLLAGACKESEDHTILYVPKGALEKADKYWSYVSKNIVEF